MKLILALGLSLALIGAGAATAGSHRSHGYHSRSHGVRTAKAAHVRAPRAPSMGRTSSGFFRPHRGFSAYSSDGRRHRGVY
jgi:hypothetical protein